MLPVSCWCHAWLILRHWWRRNVSPKCWRNIQKIEFCMNFYILFRTDFVSKGLMHLRCQRFSFCSTRKKKDHKYYVRFEVFSAVTMKNAVFWDVVPCSSCANRYFGGTYRLHLQGRKIRERGTSVSRFNINAQSVQQAYLIMRIRDIPC
jgi:hypothetical protein